MKALNRDVTPALELSKLREVKVKDYLPRFVLGALISVGAALLGKGIGARFGGMFLAFPAILPAALTLVQEKEGRRLADRSAYGAVLGGFALSVFAVVVEKSVLVIPAFAALVAALAAWLLTSVGLYACFAFLRPQDCSRKAEQKGPSATR